MDPGTVVMKQSNRYLCCVDTAGKVHLEKNLCWARTYCTTPDLKALIMYILKQNLLAEMCFYTISLV